MISEQEALELVQISGSLVSSKNTTSKTVFVDDKNPLSQWIFSSASIYKIDETQIPNAIDINVSELKPNIPAQPRDFISREQYNLLLSQSIELNATIVELRDEIVSQTDRIVELENTTENEINERTAIEQTNDVLLNQLEALSETINNFSEQISTALQKSVEESIFRTSLEAQNEGYKAQIAALVSQVDSLNAIITGLYAQLGAVLIEKEIQETAAETASANEFSWNANAVVMSSLIPTEYEFSGNNQKYYFVAQFIDRKNNSQTGNWVESDYKWLCGGGLNFQNFNRVPVEVKIQYFYPAYRQTNWNAGTQVFFKFPENTFTLLPEQVKRVAALLTPNGVADDGDRDGGNYFTITRLANGDIPSNGTPAYMEIKVKNLVNGSESSVKINIGLEMPYRS
jgi:hypothetical protein